MQTLKSICRIVQGVYSLFQSYICTPHFADGLGAARGVQVSPRWRRAGGGTHMRGPALAHRRPVAGRERRGSGRALSLDSLPVR